MDSIKWIGTMKEQNLLEPRTFNEIKNEQRFCLNLKPKLKAILRRLAGERECRIGGIRAWIYFESKNWIHLP